MVRGDWYLLSHLPFYFELSLNYLKCFSDGIEQGCCASKTASNAPPSRPSTSGPRQPALILVRAGAGAGAGSTRGAESIDYPSGDAQAGGFAHASAQGGADGNASDDDDGAGVGAATSGKRSKSAAAARRRRKDRAAMLGIIQPRPGDVVSSQKSPMPTLPEQLDTRHSHNHRRRRNSPSRPLPNTPLRPAPPSSTIRCPVDVLNTSSPLSNSRSTPLLSSNTTKSKSYGNNGYNSWTRARLTRERIAFFDTRVTGAPEIWAAVRTVIELVRDGDLNTAQGVLDAAGCTCPTGEIARGVYDERGRLYEVPDWVVGDPGDLMENEGDDGDMVGDRGSSFNGTEYKNEESDYGESNSGTASENDSEMGKRKQKEKVTAPSIKRSTIKERSREKKLKKKLDNTSIDGEKGKIIKVKVRLSDRVGDLEVSVGTYERINILVAMVREKAQVRHKFYIVYP